MEKNHELALIVAYYLSKFDSQACQKLEFKNFSVAFSEIGQILAVKPNTIKNMRDEFDPYHDNNRIGWFQRELRPSRKKVISTFGHLDETELRQIVLEILKNPDFPLSKDVDYFFRNISGEDNSTHEQPGIFILRGPTGRKAEELFLEQYELEKKPVSGILIDTRDLGCGYDFKIQASDELYFIEVKGLDAETGGVSFTSKEWTIASEEKEHYFLVLVTDVFEKPIFTYISDPVENLVPQKQIYTTIQVRWNVSASNLHPFIFR